MSLTIATQPAPAPASTTAPSRPSSDPAGPGSFDAALSAVVAGDRRAGDHRAGDRAAARDDGAGTATDDGTTPATPPTPDTTPPAPDTATADTAAAADAQALLLAGLVPTPTAAPVPATATTAAPEAATLEAGSAADAATTAPAVLRSAVTETPVAGAVAVPAPAELSATPVVPAQSARSDAAAGGDAGEAAGESTPAPARSTAAPTASTQLLAATAQQGSVPPTPTDAGAAAAAVRTAAAPMSAAPTAAAATAAATPLASAVPAQAAPTTPTPADGTATATPVVVTAVASTAARGAQTGHGTEQQGSTAGDPGLPAVTTARGGETPFVLPTTPTAAPTPATAAPSASATPAPLGQQLARPVFSLAQAGPGEHVVTVQVVPDSLGPVTVRAHVTAHGMHVELFAASEAGRDAVRQVLPDLRRDAAGTGLSTTLDLSSQNHPDTAPGRDQRPADGRLRADTGLEARRTSATQPASAATTSTIRTAGLDVLA